LAHYCALINDRAFRDWGKTQHAERAAKYLPLENLISDADLSAYVTADGTPDYAEAKMVELGMLFRFLLEELDDTAQADVEPENSFTDYLRQVVRGRAPRQGFASKYLGSRNRVRNLDQKFRSFRFK
jgi:hypothetical protein